MFLVDLVHDSLRATGPRSECAKSTRNIAHDLTVLDPLKFKRHCKSLDFLSKDILDFVGSNSNEDSV